MTKWNYHVSKILQTLTTVILSQMASAQHVVAPPPPHSLSVFKPGIFDGKVLFCTGGGSGICREMTEAVVSLLARSRCQQNTDETAS